MRRTTASAALIVAAVLLAPVAALAQTTPGLPAVSVSPGPGVEQWLVRPCTDAVPTYLLPVSFVLHRTGAVSDPLTVWYRTTGTAQPGVHFDPLPGAATFTPGAGTAVVPIVPRSVPVAQLVGLTLHIQSVSGPARFGATSAGIEFVSPWDERPVECGYRFTAAVWNRSQAVSIGQPVHALTVEQFLSPSWAPGTGVFRLVGGFLPLGVQLQPDGTFTGATRVPGTSLSVIETCRPAPPGTCVRTELAVTVAAPAVTQVPRCPWPGFSSLAPGIRTYLKQILPSLAWCS